MTPLPEPSPDEIQRLHKLLEQASATLSNVFNSSKLRLEACIEVGKTLLSWKERMKHGKWLKWANDHLPKELSATSRQRWMSLAARVNAGTLNLGASKGLLQAYKDADIIPDNGGATEGKGGNAATSYLTHLARLTEALKGICVDDLSSDERETLKGRFEPVRLFIQEL